jgi:hypothetical protein
MGCLTAPFKLIGCLGVMVALGIGWLYRERLMHELTDLIGDRGSAPPPAAATGRPGSRALASAHNKIDSLNGWRADSVVLTPAEMASLIGNGLDASLRGQLDSLQVRLREGDVEVGARLRTARLPRDLVGPLAMALRPTEPVEAAGPIRVIGRGRGEWIVRSFRIRDFPIPDAMVPRLVSRAFGDSTRRTVPLKIPAGVTDIRVHPGGATLYGAARP